MRASAEELSDLLLQAEHLEIGMDKCSLGTSRPGAEPRRPTGSWWLDGTLGRVTGGPPAAGTPTGLVDRRFLRGPDRATAPSATRSPAVGAVGTIALGGATSLKEPAEKSGAPPPLRHTVVLFEGQAPKAVGEAQGGTTIALPEGGARKPPGVGTSLQGLHYSRRWAIIQSPVRVRPLCKPREAAKQLAA